MLEKTAQYIVETVAPIFNRQGYVGTSLSDLTKATQLTKGAIYGNFKNKEDLAFKAFQYNTKTIIKALDETLTQEENHLQKLHAMVQFYRTYHQRVQGLGGCPFMNTSIDAKNNFPQLFNQAKTLERKKQQALTRILEEGIQRKEIRSSITPEHYSKNIYSMIVGAYFMTYIQNDESYLHATLDQIQNEILPELKP